LSFYIGYLLNNLSFCIFARAKITDSLITDSLWLMANIPSAHDNFFRLLLDDSQLALDYFKSALPEHVIRLLDLGSLKRLPDSYVSAELEKTMSDVVYTCRRSGGNSRVTVCLLVEHKSYRDNYTPVQIAATCSRATSTRSGRAGRG